MSRLLKTITTALFVARVSMLPVMAGQAKPNIVLILADDMGVGELSHAEGLIPTPALDSLAEEGMRFTDAHTKLIGLHADPLRDTDRSL
jgi:hypothetical protein